MKKTGNYSWQLLLRYERLKNGRDNFFSYIAFSVTTKVIFLTKPFNILVYGHERSFSDVVAEVLSGINNSIILTVEITMGLFISVHKPFVRLITAFPDTMDKKNLTIQLNFCDDNLFAYVILIFLA